MNTYYKIGIIVIGVLILGGALWFFVLSPTPEVATPTKQKDLNDILTDISGSSPEQFVRNPETIVNQNTVKEVKLDPLTEEEQAEQLLEQTVSRFVERWGTYSNQSNFSNLRSLSDQMTDTMQGRIEGYIANIKNTYPYQNGYYGVSTKVVSVNIQDFSLDQPVLTVLVGTRRDETSLDGNSDSYNQNASVTMRQLGGTWLVDSVTWFD